MPEPMAPATAPSAPGAPLADDREVAALEAGLDALEAPPAPAAGPSPLLRAVPPLVAVGSLLAAWQAAVALGGHPGYILPSPADVAATLADQAARGAVGQAVATSLRRAALGFAIALVVATPLGLAVARLRPLRTTLGPLLAGLQSLPSVAWVPAAVIWFGLTDAAMLAVILLGAVPSITNGVVAGVDQVPPLLLRAGRVLGARGLQAQRHVVLPAALPGYLAGCKQGWAFAWRSLMAAELITASPRLGVGLGQLLENGRSLSDMSLVLAAVLLILLVGILVDQVVFAPLERRVLRSRGLLAAG